MEPILSIIIPCYNSEKTLENTLMSVMNQEFQYWEAIIVNDGSTDKTEDIAFTWIEKDERFKYFSKSNDGLAKTRNFGIAKAKGRYILPLDSDNRVEQDFAENSVNILDSNPEIGVVHGHAEFIGERKGTWYIEEFNMEKILVSNYIDACAIFRKKIWSQVGGYDENMPFQGHEDWELWIAFGALKINFYHLNKITFKYFVSKTSMIRSFTEEMKVLNRDYLVKKYSLLYYNYYSSSVKTQKQNAVNLKSEKFVINAFTKMFFRFKFFK